MQCEELVQSGVASGGMLPKLDSALLAASANPKAVVKIASAAGPDAVLAALRPGTGTRFVVQTAVDGDPAVRTSRRGEQGHG
jgi:acetylglutamate kinase